MARTEFHMTARELFTGEREGRTPEWEIDVLLTEREREIREREREAKGR